MSPGWGGRVRCLEAGLDAFSHCTFTVISSPVFNKCDLCQLRLSSLALPPLGSRLGDKGASSALDASYFFPHGPQEQLLIISDPETI